MKRIIACFVICFSLLISWILLAGPNESVDSPQIESKGEKKTQNLQEEAIVNVQNPLENENLLAGSLNPNSLKTDEVNSKDDKAQKKAPNIKTDPAPSSVISSSHANSNELEVVHYNHISRKKYRSVQNSKLIPLYLEELNRNIAKAKNPELRYHMLQDRQRLLERLKKDNHPARGEKNRREANLIKRYKRSERSRYNAISNIDRIPQLLAELDQKISSVKNKKLVQLMVEDKKRLLNQYRTTSERTVEQ